MPTVDPLDMPVPGTTDNLEGLIRTVHEEGVQQAQHESEELLAAAREQAAAMVKEAEQRAEQLETETRERIERREEAASHAMKQAARDLVLAVKSSLTVLIERLIRRECAERMDGEALERLIIEVARGWIREHSDGEAVELQVSQRDHERLAASFVGRLQQELQSEVELKVRGDIRRGFRIGRRDGSMFYDFTDEEVAAALAELISPQLADLFAEPSSPNQDPRDG